MVIKTDEVKSRGIGAKLGKEKKINVEKRLKSRGEGMEEVKKERQIKKEIGREREWKKESGSVLTEGRSIFPTCRANLSDGLFCRRRREDFFKKGDAIVFASCFARSGVIFQECKVNLPVDTEDLPEVGPYFWHTAGFVQPIGSFRQIEKCKGRRKEEKRGNCEEREGKQRGRESRIKASQGKEGSQPEIPHVGCMPSPTSAISVNTMFPPSII